LAFESCAGLERVTIPSSVKTIVGGAFANCKKLTSVTFEAGGIDFEEAPDPFSGLPPFPGDLKTVYKSNGAGTYKWEDGNWSKQS
jgi:hypothetical protein